VVSGPDDQEELEPEPDPEAGPGPGTVPVMGSDVDARGPGHEAPVDLGPQEGMPSWPASGVPPSFGQRSTEEARPADAPPGPGSGYGGYRPLGSLPPSGPPPGGPLSGGPSWHQGGAGQREPEGEEPQPGTGPDEPGSHRDDPGGDWDEQDAPWEEPDSGWAGTAGGWEGPGGDWAGTAGGWVAPGSWEPGGDGTGASTPAGPHWPAPGGQEPGGEAGPQVAFGPWETYETAEGSGWSGGYGVVPDQGWAQPYDDDLAGPAHDATGGSAAAGLAGAHARDAGPGGDVPYGLHAGPGASRGRGVYSGHGTVSPEPEAPPGQGEPQGEPPPEYGEPPPGDGEPPPWQAESADSLTADLLLPGRHAAPPSGWRRALYQVTGGLVRAPQSTADRRRKDLVQRARTPVAGGHRRVAVLSLKGGVGKTTTTVGLGSTLASLRGDRVIAVDANPDRGTLSDKLRLETAATVRDLLNEEDQIRRYADVRAYTTQSQSGLEVLASDRDPTVSVAFSDQDYVDVARVLEHYYSVSITDCGTGLLHSAMAGVLRLADQIVLVSSPSVDGARSASATLDWLAAHDYGDLVRGAVVVLSAIRPRSKSAVDLARLEQHFAARCRAVVRIPYDAHLEEGAEVDLTQLSRATADAYLVLAAEVGDGFSWPRR
jgi:MinD-like ATPase involved in chromosome partitioning or flagellar assembly